MWWLWVHSVFVEVTSLRCGLARGDRGGSGLVSSSGVLCWGLHQSHRTSSEFSALDSRFVVFHVMCPVYMFVVLMIQ